MPSYKLEHGLASGKADCGNVVISQAGNSDSVMANPPGNAPRQDITNQTTYTPIANGGGTIMNPVAGDTINFGTYTVTVDNVSYGFSSNATYRAATDDKKAGYYTAGASPTAGLDDWDAADSSGK